MGVKVYIRTTIIEDLDELKRSLRPSDIEELKVSLNMPSGVALCTCIEYSEICKTVFFDNKLIGIYGVGSEGGTVSHSPWFLGTNAVKDYPLTFTKTSRKVLRSIEKQYPYLVNFIYVKSKSSIKWLKWLGFEVEMKKRELGPIKAQFHRFSKGRSKSCVHLQSHSL